MIKDQDTTPEETRPIVLHVEQIRYDPNLKHTYRQRMTVIDLELTYQHVMNLIKNLELMVSENKERGAIRVRFKGRMVLE